VQRFERLPPGPARGFPTVAPAAHLAPAVKGPAGALIRVMGGQVRQRLPPPEQLRPGRVPGQPQRLRVGQADVRPGSPAGFEPRVGGGEYPRVQNDLHLGVRRHLDVTRAREQAPPRRSRIAAARQETVREPRGRSLLQRRDHPLDQPVRTGGIPAVLAPLRPVQQRGGRPRRIVEFRELPATRDQRLHPVLVIPLVALEGRPVVLEPVRAVHGHPPTTIGAPVPAVDQPAPGVSHHRARRPQLRRAVRDPRHIEHERGQHVPPGPQVGSQVVRIVELMVHVPLGRPPPHQRTVAPQHVAAVGRDVDPGRQVTGPRGLQSPAEEAHLEVRRAGVLGRRGGVGTLGGPDPLGLGGERQGHRQGKREGRDRAWPSRTAPGISSRLPETQPRFS
jgi:hypothetical protein